MSDAVRKAVEEIADALMASDVSADSGVEVCKSIDRALAACDEPCVWKFSGPIRYPSCRANEPWAAEIVEQFACCPYCGRKIKEADDA